ncbi:TolC family protein [Desulfobacca acetoxidans]
MLVRRLVFFLIIWVLLTIQAAAAPGRVYTLKELEEIALQVHPSLKAAFEATRQADADWRITRQYPNPELDIGVSSQKTKGGEGPLTGTGYNLTVTQPIEWVGRRAKRQEAARYGIEAGKKRQDNEALNVKAKLMELFYRLLASNQLFKITTDNLDTAQNLLRLVETRVRVGESRRIELVKAQVEYANTEREFEKAKGTLETDRQVLNRFLGGHLEPNFSLSGDGGPKKPVPPIEQLRQTVLGNHPLIAVQQANINQTESTLKAERQAWVPDLNVKFFRNDDIDRRDVGGGVMLNLPVWNQKRGEAAKAAAAARQSQYELQLVKQDLETRLISQYSLYQVARKQVESFQSTILPEAAEALRLAEFTYQHGESGLLELLDSFRVYRSTQKDYYSALLDCWLTRIELWRITGGEIGN